MKKLIIALSICLVLLLGVCAALQLQKDHTGDELNRTEQTDPAQTVMVTFQVAGAVYQKQTVEVGQLPENVTVQLQGLRFVQWLDENGAETDPFAVAVAADVCYTAVYYPVLTDHVAYLFADEENRLRPDDALTADELQLALMALAAEGAQSFFPELPAGGGEVSYAQLVDLMENFFQPGAVSLAFDHSDEDVLTRAAFAQGMNVLLGYEEAETIILTPGTVIPADVTADRVDAIALLQAAVGAEVSAESTMTWTDVELPTAYEPGFVNIGGWLYYVQEDHYFLKNDYAGVLYFGEDGRYTCGDETLDATVAGILDEFITANPEMERLEILREAYDYCHEQFTYRRTYDHPAFGETGWEIQRATAMFETGKGNCYSFAAIFWALSRGLGYETRAISGTCLKDEQPHSWCIIEIDGADYFFDPEWQYAYHERGVYDKDMFMIPMDKVSYWTYKWVEE